MNYIKEKSSKNLRLNHDEERPKKTMNNCRDPIRCNQLLQTCPKEMVGPHPPQRCPGQCRQPFFFKKKSDLNSQRLEVTSSLAAARVTNKNKYWNNILITLTKSEYN